MANKVTFFLLVVIALTGSAFFSYAQHYDQRLLSKSDTYNAALTWGFVLGVNPFGTIKDIDHTIISEAYFIGFTTEQKRATFEPFNVPFQAGLFAHYKIPGANLSLYSEVSYSQQGTDFHFNNDIKQFYYDMQFKYQYINIVEMLRYYPFMARIATEDKCLQGLYVGVGPQLGINIASEDVTYYSFGPGKLPDFGDDSYQQQQLRTVLKGKTDFGITAEFGYIIPRYRLDIGIRGHLGLTDLIQVQPNSYNFKDDKNLGNFCQFVLKLDLSALGNTIR